MHSVRLYYMNALLTMMHYSFQSLDDGINSRIVYLAYLQELPTDKWLQTGLQDKDINLTTWLKAVNFIKMYVGGNRAEYNIF